MKIKQEICTEEPAVDEKLLREMGVADRLESTVTLSLARTVYEVVESRKKISIKNTFAYLAMLFPHRKAAFFKNLYYMYKRFVVESGFVLDELIGMDLTILYTASLPQIRNIMDKYALREIGVVAISQDYTDEQKRRYLCRLIDKRKSLQRIYLSGLEQYDVAFVEKVLQARKVSGSGLVRYVGEK